MLLYLSKVGSARVRARARSSAEVAAAVAAAAALRARFSPPPLPLRARARVDISIQKLQTAAAAINKFVYATTRAAPGAIDENCLSLGVTRRGFIPIKYRAEMNSRWSGEGWAIQSILPSRVRYCRWKFSDKRGAPSLKRPARDYRVLVSITCRARNFYERRISALIPSHCGLSILMSSCLRDRFRSTSVIIIPQSAV